MSHLQTRNPARRGEHALPYRRAHLASEAVVARYLNDISGRRGQAPARRTLVSRPARADVATC